MKRQALLVEGKLSHTNIVETLDFDVCEKTLFECLDKGYFGIAKRILFTDIDGIRFIKTLSPTFRQSVLNHSGFSKLMEQLLGDGSLAHDAATKRDVTLFLKGFVQLLKRGEAPELALVRLLLAGDVEKLCCLLHEVDEASQEGASFYYQRLSIAQSDRISLNLVFNKLAQFDAEQFDDKHSKPFTETFNNDKLFIHARFIPTTLLNEYLDKILTQGTNSPAMTKLKDLLLTRTADGHFFNVLNLNNVATIRLSKAFESLREAMEKEYSSTYSGFITVFNQRDLFCALRIAYPDRLEDLLDDGSYDWLTQSLLQMAAPPDSNFLMVKLPFKICEFIRSHQRYTNYIEHVQKTQPPQNILLLLRTFNQVEVVVASLGYSLSVMTIGEMISDSLDSIVFKMPMHSFAVIILMANVFIES